jgi:hypothetical protein
MRRIKQLTRAFFIALCLGFIFNVGGVQGILARACEGDDGGGMVIEGGDACVTRSGGNYICDCVGDNCGKTCSRQISGNCPGATCKAQQ